MSGWEQTGRGRGEGRGYHKENKNANHVLNNDLPPELSTGCRQGFVYIFLFRRTLYLNPPEFLWESGRGLSTELEPAGKGCLVPAHPLHLRAVNPEVESTHPWEICGENKTIHYSPRGKNRTRKKQFMFQEINFKSTNSVLWFASGEEMGLELRSFLCTSSFQHK